MRTASRGGTRPRSSNVRILCLSVALIAASPTIWAQTDQIPPPSDNPDDPLPAENCGLLTSKGFLPNTNFAFIFTKVLDCKTRTIKSVVTDLNGQVVDLNTALNAETKARSANPKAKVSKDLRHALNANPKKRRRIIVWLDADIEFLGEFAAGLLEPLAPNLGEAPQYSEQFILDVEDQILSFNKAQMAERTQSFRKKIGNRVVYVDEYAPVAVVWANRREARILAEMAEVESLYLESNSGPLSREGLIAHRVLPEWANSSFGAGRRVAVLEDEPIESGRYLDVAEYFRPGDSAITDDDSGHAQKVAGIIQSRWLPRIGTAPLVQLFSANTPSLEDTMVTWGLSWVMDKRIDVTNLSWGGPVIERDDGAVFAPDGEMHYLDRIFDLHARYNLHSFVAAAGNQRGDFVHSPATAWNVIAVGNVVTGPDPDPDPADWSNDRMNGNSSSVNPLNRNAKPNVVARGTNVRTLGVSRFGYIPVPDPDSGTSLAAPFVTATLALAFNRNPTLLPAPEAAMATVMASAWNNVDGPESRPISNRDGAGGIHTSAAALVAANYRTTYTYINPSALAGSGYRAIPIELNAGERTRIAITWFADARAYVHELGYLQADLDLLVYEGPPESTGFIRAASVSRFNNTELVDFVPERSGTHTIAIFAPRLNGSRNERVGVAVSLYDHDAVE